MTKHCAICGKTIDPEHDAHFRCRELSHNLYLCPSCSKKSNSSCPVCGQRPLQYEESITKSVFESPGTRGLLGF